MTDIGKSTLPFITREMKRLKIVKNIELKKNKSTSNVSSNKFEFEGINNLKKRQFRFCKIYKYYYSKNRIEERLINQEIRKMKLELDLKQEKEKKEYNDTFHKNYPPENETDYTNEIKAMLRNENIIEKNKEKFEAIKKNFLEKKHDEYIHKMGIEFEKGFDVLNQRFKKEKDEQNLVIKKIILNHQLRTLERNNKIKENNEENNKNNKRFFYSHFQFNLNKDIEKENKIDKDNLIMGNMTSKIFRFMARGTPHKTIII